MIEIITNEGVSLDILPDADFSIEYESPVFSDDRMPVPYSTEISFPSSLKNNAVFGYLPGVASLPSISSLPVSIFCSGVQILTGKLVFDGLEDRVLKYSFSGSGIAESFEAMDISRFIPQKNILKEAIQDIKRGEYLFVKAPLLIDANHVADAVYDGISDSTKGCGIYSKYINFYTDDDPVRFIPAFPLGQFLYNAFIQNHQTLSVDSKLAEWLETVHLLGQYKPAATDGDEGLFEDVSGVLLSQTLPDVSIADFLVNVLKLFCSALFPDGSGYAMKSLSDIVSGVAVENWDNKLGVVSELSRDFTSKYVFGYNNEDDVNSYSAEQLTGDLQSGKVLLSENIGNLRGLLVEDDYKVIYHKNSGYVYSGKKKSCGVSSDRGGTVTTQEFEQTIIDSLLHPAKNICVSGLMEDNSDFDSSVEFTLVRCIPEYVNTAMRNIYANAPKIAPVLKLPEIGNERGKDMYIGLIIHNQMTDSGVIFNEADLSTEYVSPFRLSPQYVYDKFHDTFAKWMLKDKLTITVPLKLTVLDLASFRMYNKVYFHGHEWLVKKLSFTMSAMSDIVEVTGEFVSV